MQTLSIPLASSDSPKLGGLRSIQQTILSLFFTFSFIHPVTADNCGGKAAFRDWVEFRHALDAEIPRRENSYDPETGVYNVNRESDDHKSRYDFEVEGNRDGLTNVDIPIFFRGKESEFSANDVLYYEIYSANYRFGLIKNFSGHAQLPRRFNFDSVNSEETMVVNHQLGKEYGFPESYTLDPDDDAFDQYLHTSGSLARSTQRVVDKANSYLKPGEPRWRITKIEVEGSRTGSNDPAHPYTERYDTIHNFYVTVEKGPIEPI